MTFSFHPEAESEFHEAINYYESCDLGLGYDFSIEVHAIIQNIVNYPTAWPVIEEEVRRGYRELRRRGISRDLAWNTAKSAHGPWRLSRSPGLAHAQPGSYFDGLGVPRLYIRGLS